MAFNFNRMFGRSERPQYSFELINKSLLRENRKELVNLIAAAKGAEGAEKVAKTNQLAAHVASLFEDLQVDATEVNLSDFIRTFAEEADAAIAEAMRVKKNSGEPHTIESVISPTVAEVPSEGVPQPRRVTTDIYAGVEPVAQPVRSATERGYAIVDRVLAEVNKTSGKPATQEVPVIIEDKPRHVASQDSIHPSDDTMIEWKPPVDEFRPEGPGRQTL